MKGLFIWAHSYCRSTLAFYKGLALAFKCSLKIVVLEGLPDLRLRTGFNANEFGNLDISQYEDIDKSVSLMDNYYDYYHIFASYQNGVGLSLINIAIEKKIHFAICSEAPCNMSPWPKHFIKDLYINYLLPRKLGHVIKNADFIINCSGNDKKSLQNIGWPNEKIIPCGYYSPPIEGSKTYKRGEEHWKNFKILLTGIHQWHRSPWLLLEALHILDKKGIQYQCDITQEGPYFDKLKKYIEKHSMKNVQLCGFLPLEELISKYENCSVYVGTGNYEPWGMRLNDALCCGAPLIVNRGMGGHKLVDDYNCGITFKKNDARELASSLEKLILNKDLYLITSEAAYLAARLILPEIKAQEIANIIQEKLRTIY